MRPLACDRSRAWISLRLDGELSKFEHVLLGAHLAVCRDCRRFASDVEWQTKGIRGAPLERLTRPITIPSTRSWRRPALGVSTAAVAASIAALAIGLRGPSTARPQAPAPRALPAASIQGTAGDTSGVRRGGLSTAEQAVGTLRGDPNASS
jgi:hypothetical protein